MMPRTTVPADIVRSFYSALAVGDTDATMALLSDNVRWFTMTAWQNPEEDEMKLLTDFISLALAEKYASWWVYKLNGRAPQEVLEYVLNPLLKAGSGFIP